MYAHHVPEDCDGEIIELNAAIMATAAGTLGTDAAFDLDLASGSDFFGGELLCDYTGTLHHECNLRASDEKCMEFWLSQPASKVFLSPLIFLLVAILLQLSLQRLSAEPEFQLQQQQRVVLLARLSQARPVFQLSWTLTSLGFER